MIQRFPTFGLVFAALLLGLSSGDAQAARRGGKAACMEAVVPKCKVPQFFFCAKKSKCGSCAKWTCRVGAAPHA